MKINQRSISSIFKINQINFRIRVTALNITLPSCLFAQTLCHWCSSLNAHFYYFTCYKHFERHDSSCRYSYCDSADKKEPRYRTSRLTLGCTGHPLPPINRLCFWCYASTLLSLTETQNCYISLSAILTERPPTTNDA